MLNEAANPTAWGAFRKYRKESVPLCLHDQRTVPRQNEIISRAQRRQRFL
jgi:hypothetical protein